MSEKDNRDADQRRGSRRATASEGLTRAEARKFVEHSTKEHVSNLVSFVLVLLAPAALFWTLAFLPWTAEDPALATIVGLALALILVIAGLVVHFVVPRKRHDVLEAVEEGHVEPTPESAKVAKAHREKAKPLNAVLLGIGFLAVLASLACAVHAFMTSGFWPRIFLDIGCAFGLAAVAFAAFYWPFTTRRLARHLGAAQHPSEEHEEG